MKLSGSNALSTSGIGAFLGFFWLGLLLLPAAAYSNEPDQHPNAPGLRQARELLLLSAPQALERIKTLNAVRAAELSSQMRYLVRSRNPDIDRIYLVLHHLESLQATALAQKRLNNLLWVIGLTLLLFCGFLIYVLLDQRRTIMLLRGSFPLVKQKQDQSAVNSPVPVYRGDE